MTHKTVFNFIIKHSKPITLLVVLSVLSNYIFSYNTLDNKEAKGEYKFYNLKQQGWKSKRITQFIDDINYTATEVPLQYYISKNLEHKPQLVDSIYRTNHRERVIEIEFQHVDQKDLLQQEFTHKTYEESVRYMAFAIEKDFKVITSSNKIITCSGVQLERNFKVAPFKRVLLYFDDIDPNDIIQLVYQDQLFGNGTLKFNFNNTPILL